jgi:site-specific DNA recombinase
MVDEELWNAVQAKLAGNLTRRRQARIESGAVLGGLIFDDRGNRMSPTYTMRRGSRYRYYVSRICGKSAKALGHESEPTMWSD